MAKIVKAQPSSAPEAFEKIQVILNDQAVSWELKRAATNALAEIVKAQPAVASGAVEAIKVILNSRERNLENQQIKQAAINVLAEIVKAQPSSALEAFEKIKVILNDWEANSNLKKAATYALAEIVKAQPAIAPEVVKTIKIILNVRKANDWLKEVTTNALLEIVKALPSRDADDYLKEATTYALAEIVKAQPEVASESVEAIKIILNDQTAHLQLKQAATKVLTEIVKAQLEVASEAVEAIKIILNDQTAHLQLKYAATNALPEILQAMPFDKVVDLLNDQIKAFRDAAIVVISDKLKDNEEVKKLDYTKAVTILSIIDMTRGDEDKKEFNLSAKKALEHIVTTVDEVGVKWLSDHFEELPTSPATRSFLKAIFHQTLSDGVISEIENEFILKCITKLGFTFSVSREREIIFEGVKYPMDIASDKLEEIVREILKNSSDQLTQYYRNHAPLFTNSGSAMPIASLDMKDGGSILDGTRLEDDKWLVSLMHLSDDKKIEPANVFILLEKANILGGHCMYKIFVNKEHKLEISNKYDILSGKISPELRKEIFGEMDYHDKAIFGKSTKLKYYGSTVETDLASGDNLIKSAQNDQTKYTPKDEYVLMRKLLQPIMGDILGDNVTDWPSYSANLEQVQEFSKAQLFPGLKLDKRDSVIVEQHRSGVNIESKVEKLEYRLDQADKIAEALDEKLKVSDTISKRDKAAIKSEISSLKEGLKTIKGKVDAQDPILKIITAEVNELINAKDISYEAINDINEKLEKLTSRERIETCAYIQEMSYDNELLNHPEMFNKLADIYGANRVLEVSGQMPPLVLHQVIESGNLELLGNILSLD